MQVFTLIGETMKTLQIGVINIRKLSCLLFVFFVWCLPSMAIADAACKIIYGKDWAFAITVPEKWESVCHAEKEIGVSFGAWLQGENWQDAHTRFYIAAGAGHTADLSLADFADDSLKRFRMHSPNVTVTAYDHPNLRVQKENIIIKKFNNDKFKNHEIVAYVKAPSTYHIFVFSSKSKEGFDKHSASFVDFLSSYTPIAITVQGNISGNHDIGSILNGLSADPANKESLLDALKYKPVESK
jgi:hypothetical protein